MTEGTPRPDAAELRALVLEFTDAFNRDDLDAVMDFFTEDAFYDEFHGGRSRGRAAIRKAFEPQFAGLFGRIRFETEDVFADPGEGKAVVRWLCVIEKDGLRRAWRGLDVLGFSGRKLAWKETYAKAPVPDFRDPAA
jgi:ketosteroid isomerase-like protein